MVEPATQLAVLELGKLLSVGITPAVLCSQYGPKGSPTPAAGAGGTRTQIRAFLNLVENSGEIPVWLDHLRDRQNRAHPVELFRPGGTLGPSFSDWLNAWQQHDPWPVVQEDLVRCRPRNVAIMTWDEAAGLAMALKFPGGHQQLKLQLLRGFLREFLRFQAL